VAPQFANDAPKIYKADVRGRSPSFHISYIGAATPPNLKQPFGEESFASESGVPKEFGYQGRERRKQNRRIGRNTLLLQMINPALASNALKSSVSSPADELAAVRADGRLGRASDNVATITAS
jgi:hypothetical protein